ncbi:hypothetical protein ACF0H5_003787 [Mactra antiquata]
MTSFLHEVMSVDFRKELYVSINRIYYNTLTSMISYIVRRSKNKTDKSNKKKSLQR